MEKILEACFPRLKFTDEEVWKLEELIDEYIDKRIESRLDQEFNRGDWRRD
jgi:hypothetical protein